MAQAYLDYSDYMVATNSHNLHEAKLGSLFMENVVFEEQIYRGRNPEPGKT